jgi:hypothetical protein
MYSVCFKKDLAKRFHPSKFDIQYSIFCGSLFRLAAKVAGLNHQETVSFWRSFIQGFRAQRLQLIFFNPER